MQLLNKKTDVDETDEKIIAIMQKNPTITHSQVASMVNMSQPTVGNRVKRLEDEGILQKNVGINPVHCGFALFIIRINSNDIKTVVKKAKNQSGIMNLFRTVGKYNIVILLCSHDLNYPALKDGDS